MAPTVILIRHAEALHRDFTIHDPPLTDYGLNTQCATLKTALQALPIAQETGLIIVSPMTRTLQTAQASLGWLMDRGVPAIARAEWQETTVNNIDIGRPISELASEFPAFDFGSVDPVFPKKQGLYEFSYDALLERGRVARRWLKERKEKVVVIVGHDGFMRVGVCQRKFGNADFRIFEFEEGNGLGLIEWKTTEANGGGLGTCQKGKFGWLPNDFKYMPNKPRQEVIETALAGGLS